MFAGNEYLISMLTIRNATTMDHNFYFKIYVIDKEIEYIHFSL